MGDVVPFRRPEQPEPSHVDAANHLRQVAECIASGQLIEVGKSDVYRAEIQAPRAVLIYMQAADGSYALSWTGLRDTHELDTAGRRIAETIAAVIARAVAAQRRR